MDGEDRLEQRATPPGRTARWDSVASRAGPDALFCSILSARRFPMRIGPRVGCWRIRSLPPHAIRPNQTRLGRSRVWSFMAESYGSRTSPDAHMSSGAGDGPASAMWTLKRGREPSRVRRHTRRRRCPAAHRDAPAESDRPPAVSRALEINNAIISNLTRTLFARLRRPSARSSFLRSSRVASTIRRRTSSDVRAGGTVVARSRPRRADWRFAAMAPGRAGC
jgi:hypothetical protein